MANVQLSSRNFIDEDTVSLSGGDWVTSLALLKDRRLSATARSADSDPASTVVRIDMGPNPEPVNLLGIIRPSFTGLVDQWRLTGGTSSGSSNRYDSGWQPGFPRAYTLADRPFETENWWFGTLTSRELTGYPTDVYWTLPGMITARHWTLEFDVLGEWFEVSRLWLGYSWRPTRNMNRDSIVYEDLSEVQQSLGGVAFFDVRPKRRLYRFSLPYMSEDEAFGDAMNLQRNVGITGDVVVLSDSDDLVRGHKRNFYGRLRQLDPLERTAQGYAMASTSFVIEELL